MMRILFGLILALLVAVPPLFDIALAATTLAASQPPVLAFAAGVLAWPRITRTVRRWTR
ncbi:ABC-type dipeptide/oligopeptide/nickel transport system permease subunit [Streptomyces sp. V3I8]|uniref:hypothetical protein n=1 Tax=Streptomyces sp. V3I8 TaxID=3042279 RepID=UPI00278AF993|nr:hypothetical protein [Streptomyces sp. V3I8]MDQ1037246.1 ABC-type dipeptide/oligopeptide/nickel transport system permease subunit [Streptomyces sp. V3I8]